MAVLLAVLVVRCWRQDGRNAAAVRLAPAAGISFHPCSRTGCAGGGKGLRGASAKEGVHAVFENAHRIRARAVRLHRPHGRLSASVRVCRSATKFVMAQAVRFLRPLLETGIPSGSR